MWQVWGRGELHAGLMRKSEKSENMEDIGVDGSVILTGIFKK
jgi:hypothetical protein